jgi:hypothetical protein
MHPFRTAVEAGETELSAALALAEAMNAVQRELRVTAA